MIYAIPLTTLDGQPTTLAPYKDKVLLIVNLASRCGLTPQYAGLESLFRRYQSQGLVVLGFPCNQFGAQEPGTAEQIRDFCTTTYDITFPLFAKIDVNGDDAHPLYQHLKSSQPGILGSEAIKWNFTKFLINRLGQVTHRFAPTDTPESLDASILGALGSHPNGALV
jgi:glutathione peroxidase